MEARNRDSAAADSGFSVAEAFASSSARRISQERQAMERVSTKAIWAGAFALAIGSSALAQTTVAPAKGQSQAQMQKDMADCQTIAKQSSGYDPAAANQAQSESSGAHPRPGGRLRGAAVGGLAGAARAEVQGQQHAGYDRLPDSAKQNYRQNQAQSGAAAGAVVGGARSRQQRRQGMQAQQQQQAQASAAQNAYAQAYKGCLSGRGYVVK